ncbi:MAG: ribonuclease E/G [Proteobacteria bacterium]|nr:ribonuclease E/G [Pseudomonadota bacterium]MBW3617687.1 ribonuclease E/G [Pseudomonadota bacterium]
MSARTLFLDKGIGESRAVVQLRGRPERLLIERDGDSASARLGARVAARVRRLDRTLNLAFLDLGEGVEAVAEAAKLVEGAALEVEVTAEPRAGKAAAVRVLGPAEGEAPRLLAPAPSLEKRLQSFARGALTRGPDAREAADEAEETALALLHPLPEGGSLSVEPTRGMVAVDVDLGARGGADAKRAARAANLAALTELARLLRLKALGGLIVVDLAGRGHDGDALSRAAREAFHPDQPGVNLGPISRFGTMEILKPWRDRPLAERLNDPDGRPSALTAALRLARTLEREGRVHGGARLLARAHPEVLAAFAALQPRLVERLGPRFEVQPDLALDRAHTDVTVR